VTVTTAFPLTGELSARLQANLEELTGREVEMNVIEDPTLLGGIVVRVGDTLYDGSIKTQLNNMRNLLGRNNSAWKRSGQRKSVRSYPGR